MHRNRIADSKSLTKVTCTLEQRESYPSCSGSDARTEWDVFTFDFCLLYQFPLGGGAAASHGLSCPLVHGIFIPQPGMEHASPALEGRFLTTGPPGKTLCQHIAFKKKDLFTYLYFWLHWIFFALLLLCSCSSNKIEKSCCYHCLSTKPLILSDFKGFKESWIDILIFSLKLYCSR